METAIYIHRVRGKIQVSNLTPMKRYFNEILNIKDGTFGFSLSKKMHFNFQENHPYSLIEVKLIDGKKPKHWASIDDTNNCIYFSSLFPYKKIEEFKAVLVRNNIHLFYKSTTYNYVELCCRYPVEKLELVKKSLSKLISVFNTNKTRTFEMGISDGSSYSYLIKNLYKDNFYFNIKTYLFVDNFKGEDQEISEARQPKLEVQIEGVDTIEKAVKIGVPILKSVIENAGLEIIPMNKGYEICDYQLVDGTGAMRQDERVSFYLINEPKRKVLPYVPKWITDNRRRYDLVRYLWHKNASIHKIYKDLNISKRTAERSIKNLGKVIERRGDKGSGYLYQTDVFYLLNICHKLNVIN